MFIYSKCFVFTWDISLFCLFCMLYCIIANFFILKWVTWIIENRCTCVSWFSLSCPETTQEVYKYWIWILEVTLATLWQNLVTCILKYSKVQWEYSQNVLWTLICVLCSLKCTVCFLCGYISRQITLYSVSVYWDNKHCQIVP